MPSRNFNSVQSGNSLSPTKSFERLESRELLAGDIAVGIAGQVGTNVAQVAAVNLGTGETTYDAPDLGGGFGIAVPSGWYSLLVTEGGVTRALAPVVVDNDCTEVDFADAEIVDTSYADLVVTDNLNAYVAESSSEAGQLKRYSDWVPNVINFDMGDFNGDGLDDIIGHAANGKIWVGIANGLSSFSVRQFGTLSNSSINWTNFTVADFDGDGRSDVLVRADTDGSWWVLRSNGNEFSYQQVAKFNPVFNWTFATGDFDGDGRHDIAGRAGSNGSWWVGLSNGTTAPPSNWGNWSTDSQWTDYLVGDFNGDGRDDVAGRANNSSWFVAESTGNAFATSAWSGWSGSTWEHFTVADLNGDGADDIAGRSLATGDWWVGSSTGSSFSPSSWGNWPISTQWLDVLYGDYNGDGLDDLVGRAENGEWWLLLSEGSSFDGKFAVNVGRFVSNAAVGYFGSTLPAPEVELLFGQNEILDGSFLTSEMSGTDFGEVSVSGSGVSRTYTVRNVGTGELTTRSLTLPSGFTLEEGLNPSIPAGGSDTFTVRLDANGQGTRTGLLSFVTNDADEGFFSFWIRGFVDDGFEELVFDGDSRGNDVDFGFGGAEILDAPITTDTRLTIRGFVGLGAFPNIGDQDSKDEFLFDIGARTNITATLTNLEYAHGLAIGEPSPGMLIQDISPTLSQPITVSGTFEAGSSAVVAPDVLRFMLDPPRIFQSYELEITFDVL